MTKLFFLAAAIVLTALPGWAGASAAQTAEAPRQYEATGAEKAPAQVTAATVCDVHSEAMTMRIGKVRLDRATGKATTDNAYPTIGILCPESALKRAGLLPGDVVLEINGKDARGRTYATEYKAARGSSVVLRIRRAAEEREVILEVPAPDSTNP